MSLFKKVMSIFMLVSGIFSTIIGVLFFHFGFTKISQGTSLSSVFTDVVIVVFMSFVPLILGIFLCYYNVKRIIYRDHYNYDDNNRKDVEMIDEYFDIEKLRHEAEMERENVKYEREKAEKLWLQAEIERKNAEYEREKAEELKRKAAEEWERIRKEMNVSKGDMKDPYFILGVHKSDSLETIKQVFKKLAHIYHPDKHGKADNLSRRQKDELMKRINAAYEWILKHHR